MKIITSYAYKHDVEIIWKSRASYPFIRVLQSIVVIIIKGYLFNQYWMNKTTKTH